MKSSKKIIIALTFCVATALVVGFFFSGYRSGKNTGYDAGYQVGQDQGYTRGATEGLTLKDGVIYTERDLRVIHGVGDYESIRRILHHIEVEGLQVYGKITSVDIDEVVEISQVIRAIPNVDPILSIKVLSNTHVEVTTGVVHGPESGGGEIYDVKKNDEKWELFDTGSLKSWVS